MHLFNARAAFGDIPIVIAAAGNESRRNERRDFKIAASLPAAAGGIVSVAAAGIQGEEYGVAYFSNTYAKVSAPGVNILSTAPGGSIVSMNRTSMPSLHVAGVAALWWECAVKNNTLAPCTLALAKLTASASTQHFSPEFDNVDSGLGLVTAPL